jgi:signal transduction histidine kinase
MDGLHEMSLRIKYEGFAKLTTELSLARSFPDVAHVLQTNLKFIFNFTAYRILIFYESEQRVLQITRQTYQVAAEPVVIYPAEADVISNRMTTVWNEHALTDDAAAPLDTLPRIHPLFHPPDNKHLCLYPLRLDDHQYMLLAAGNKEDQAPTDADYRFFRMVSEFLFSKCSQLFLTERLENIVEKRTQQLNAANRELANLFYKASHDFSAPLKTLLGLVRLCRMQSENPPELAFLFDQINEVIARTQTMLLKLKVISETESLIRGIERIDLYTLLQQVAETHNTSPNRMRFDISVAGNGSIIFSDDILITLLDNLVENAVQYHRAIPDAFIRLRAESSASMLRLVVEDNGQGIEPSQLKNIFELYTRTNINSKGNGIGLYLVRKVVHKLNGAVNVTSQPNQGSRFEIILPL